jgi:hypothetical protein
MNSISVTYTLKYELSFAPNYKWTECGKCFNTRTGRQVKQTLVGGSIGYCINSKFKSLKFLRENLVKIKHELLPF